MTELNNGFNRAAHPTGYGRGDVDVGVRDGRQVGVVEAMTTAAAGEAAAKTAEPDAPQVGLWDDPVIAEALASRSVGAIFRFLQGKGFSQRRIGGFTGQSQSEICEILAGRSVTSYDVLVRIGDGLGIPRGRLGLAYDSHVCQPVNPASLAAAISAAAARAGVVAEGRCEACPLTTVDRSHRKAPGTRQRAAKTGALSFTVSAEQVVQARALVSATLTPEALRTVYAVAVWTGLHIRALRQAKRMSVRQLAKYLGVSNRMVSKWEAGGVGMRPRAVNQEALDTTLAMATPEEKTRFAAILAAVQVQLAADADTPANEPEANHVDGGELAGRGDYRQGNDR